MLDFWKNYTPYDLHPADKEYFQQNNLYNRQKFVNANYEQVVEEFGENLKSDDINTRFKQIIRDESRVIRKLFASPFVGNINNAKVYILSLNPGFHSGDFIDEYQNPQYIDLLKRNLLGEVNTFCFAEEISLGTGAYKYWSQKVRMIANKIAEAKSLSIHEAFKITLSNICLIESFPYHSYRKPTFAFDEIPSCIVAKKFVKDVVVKRAENDECLVCAWRMVNFWDLPDNVNIIKKNPRYSKNKLQTSDIELIADFLTSIL